LESLKKEKGEKVSVKTWIEIFCETFPNFGEAGVHPAFDKSVPVAGVGAVEVQNLESSRTHIAGDGDILDHMVSDRFMAFDLFVGISTKQDELAVRRSKTSEGSFGPVGQVKEDEEVDEGDDKFFAPCERFQIGP